MTDIDRFAGLYAAFPNGQIWSYPKYRCKNGRFLKPIKHSNGYFFVCLRAEHVYKIKSIHRIIAETFIQNSQNLPQVNHKDGDKSNNDIGNLEWCSARQNMQHALKKGLLTSLGEGQYASKLKEKDVLAIRSTYVPGKITMKSLALRYGVDTSMIGLILKRKKWKHI